MKKVLAIVALSVLAAGGTFISQGIDDPKNDQAIGMSLYGYRFV